MPILTDDETHRAWERACFASARTVREVLGPYRVQGSGSWRSDYAPWAVDVAMLWWDALTVFELMRALEVLAKAHHAGRDVEERARAVHAVVLAAGSSFDPFAVPWMATLNAIERMDDDATANQDQA